MKQSQSQKKSEQRKVDYRTKRGNKVNREKDADKQRLTIQKKKEIESTTKGPPGRKVDHRRKSGNRVNHEKDTREERLTAGEKEKIKSTAKKKQTKKG